MLLQFAMCTNDLLHVLNDFNYVFQATFFVRLQLFFKEFDMLETLRSPELTFHDRPSITLIIAYYCIVKPYTWQYLTEQ